MRRTRSNPSDGGPSEDPTSVCRRIWFPSVQCMVSCQDWSWTQSWLKLEGNAKEIQSLDFKCATESMRVNRRGSASETDGSTSTG